MPETTEKFDHYQVGPIKVRFRHPPDPVMQLQADVGDGGPGNTVMLEFRCPSGPVIRANPTVRVLVQSRDGEFVEPWRAPRWFLQVQPTLSREIRRQLFSMPTSYDDALMYVHEMTIRCARALQAVCRN